MKLIIFANLFIVGTAYKLFLLPKIFRVEPFYQSSQGLSHQNEFSVKETDKEKTLRSAAKADGFNARFFGAFNNFNLPNVFPKNVKRSEFANLLDRVTSLENGVGGRGMVPIDQVRALLEEIKPRCPSTAFDSHVIGDKCYSVELEPVEFNVAAQICHNKGGILAEPAVANRQEFYTNIKHAFPSQIKEIESRQGNDRNLFIGLQKSTTFSTTFVFLSCGVTVNAFDDNIFTPIPKIDFQVAQKAAVVPPGTMWQRVGSLTGGEKHSFICQYNTLI